MFPETDEAAVQADAYIDGLLSSHGRSPVPVMPGEPLAGTASVRDAIDLLERGLPRFHPSFLFEEWLARQLRQAATRSPVDGNLSHSADVLPFGLPPRPIHGQARLGDRRLWVGGAIASGVSIGAAMVAWRRRRD